MYVKVLVEFVLISASVLKMQLPVLVESGCDTLSLFLISVISMAGLHRVRLSSGRYIYVTAALDCFF